MGNRYPLPYLNKLFDLLNREFEESVLSRPTITIQSKPGAYSHFSLRDNTWSTLIRLRKRA